MEQRLQGEFVFILRRSFAGNTHGSKALGRIQQRHGSLLFSAMGILVKLPLCSFGRTQQLTDLFKPDRALCGAYTRRGGTGGGNAV